MSEPPLVRAVLPDLAARIEAGLQAQGEERIAEQIDDLRITAVCTCEHSYCGSFYTSTRPMKRWFMRGRQVTIEDGEPGEITVDVVRGEISYVEVLHLEHVRQALCAFPPRE
jgi:hypothetical protein